LAEDQQGLQQAWPYVINDGVILKRTFRAATAWVEKHAEEINALNVFPVPDGDTGTNMLLTCHAAREETDKVGNSIPEVMRAIAHGSLMGARGNSGVILSQILRGMARSIDNKPSLTPKDMAAALQEGSVTAYKGVLKPVEGTILTVIRETAATALEVAEQTDDFREFFAAVVKSAHESVERTPSLLPTLRLAGVVDAGGRGLALLLEGILKYIRGESVLTTTSARAQVERIEAPEEGWGYDVQYIIRGDALDVDTIRTNIASIGESTLVVGDQYTVKVHTHCPNPGPALQYGASVGTLSHVIIENMQQQSLDFSARSAPGTAEQGTGAFMTPSRAATEQRRVQDLLAGQSTTSTQLTGIGTVVVAFGPGFEHVFKSLDASVIVPGGQTMNPSTQEILAAIEAVPADKVIVLPNNKNIILTAQQACGLSGKSAVVVPTKTIPQGISALLSLNYDADLNENRASMEEAAARVRTGEITTAVRDSHLDGIDVLKGQLIGLVDDRLVATGGKIEDVVMATLAVMCAHDSELVTFYFGNGVQADEARLLVEHARKGYPAIETEVLEGGQPHYMYIISAE
jgi:uncharacterized protein